MLATTYRLAMHLVAAIAISSVYIVGCKPSAPSAAKPSPAVVDTIAHEDKLNTIKLTEEAARRLGIATAAVATTDKPRKRSFGGEIVLPTGAAIVVAAPVAGTLQPPGKDPPPAVGAAVKEKQAVFLLAPLVSSERSVLAPSERIRLAEAQAVLAQSQVDAAGQVAQAQSQVDAADIALKRAERLLKEQAGTVRAVDDAKAQLELATKARDAALERKKVVDAVTLDDSVGPSTTLAIESPRAGVLRTEHAAVGEVVAAGAPLFEVIDVDPVWVKVSVFAGERAEVAADRPAAIRDLGRWHEATQSTPAKPIAAPPSAQPLTAAVDLYFELPNPDGRFKPGERVTADLELSPHKPNTPTEPPLTIPRSAIVYDIQGGTWVYVQTESLTFVRHRVALSYIDGEQAVLEKGPPPGSLVVTKAVTDLFGTEFGFAK